MAATIDAVETEEGLTVVLADVGGKGVSAALLASTLQGMIYSQLTADMPLTEIVTGVNRANLEVFEPYVARDIQL